MGWTAWGCPEVPTGAGLGNSERGGRARGQEDSGRENRKKGLIRKAKKKKKETPNLIEPDYQPGQLSKKWSSGPPH